MFPDDVGQKYAAIVWGNFTQRSGKSERMMSPLEWHLLSRWMEAEIPLRIVLRAMEDTKGRPGTLRFYEKPVEAAVSHWRQSLTD